MAQQDVLIRYLADTSDAVAAAGRVDAALKQNAKEAKAAGTELSKQHETAGRSAIVLSDREKEVAARIIGTKAALKAKADALGLTVAETKKLTAEVTRLDKVQLSQASATTTASVATRKLSKDAYGARQVMRNLGYQVGDVVQTIQAGGDPLNAFVVQLTDIAFQLNLTAVAAKAAQFAMSPAALGIAALGTAVVVAANQIDEARQGLKEYTKAVNDSKGAVDDLRQAENALKLATGDVDGFIGNLQIQTALLRGEIEDSDVAAGELGNQLAKKLRGDLLKAGDAVKNNETQIQSLNKAIRSGRLDVEEMSAAQQELSERMGARGDLQQALDEIKAKQAEGQDAINEYAKAMDEAGEQSEDTGRSIRKQADAVSQMSEAYRESVAAMDESTAASQASQAATQRLLDIADSERESRMTGVELIEAQTKAREAEALAIYQTAVAQATSDDERTKALNAFKDAQDEIRDSELESIEEFEARKQELAEQTAEVQVKATQKRLDAELSAASDVMAAVESVAAMVVQSAEQRVAAGEELSEAERKQARAAFAVQKSAAISTILMDTAQGVMAIWAQWAALPPVAAALTAGLTAVAGTQIGAVAAEQPKFHTGGIIGGSMQTDERPVTALTGEALLNRAATSALGQDGVNALNRGEMAGGQTIVVQQRYKHRVFDAFVYDNYRRPGAPLRSAIKGDSRVGHRS
jgi:chromosome segregation ATPase